MKYRYALDQHKSKKQCLNFLCDMAKKYNIIAYGLYLNEIIQVNGIMLNSKLKGNSNLEIVFPIYIDYINEYDDWFLKKYKKSFCPNHDYDFYNNEIIKTLLIEYTESMVDCKYMNNTVNTLECVIPLTEDEIFYLSLKYNNFVDFYNIHRIINDN